MSYKIKTDYIHRETVIPFSDIHNTDKFQDEVYSLASKLCTCQNILDIGCGSGFKLVKYFPHSYYNLLGVDDEPTVKFLKEKYPDNNWSTTIPEDFKPDLIICSDVIEHVEDPGKFLNKLRLLDPKYLVISTPERDLLWGKDHLGPPPNISHYREWNREEFMRFVCMYFPNFIYYDVCNKIEGTQVIICSP